MPEESRIEIQKDGPYRVFGAVPLKEMAPVQTFNGEPIDWHTLRELPVPTELCELCRCGKSKNKPFCDKSHETVGFNGSEPASRKPYLERAQKHVAADDLLADDGPLCIGAGFCRTRTTTVWKLLAQSPDPQSREKMQAMVWRCPSGRISLFSRSDGAPLELDLPQEIAILPGGPLWVRGAIPITGADGHAWELSNRVTLCRCGESKNKPFCDGTHSDIHFDER